ncbi:MAG: hypothetical protein U9O98_00420, partial [Asgard group archaeon]|nr:hypothetical protein [Asgard group archaeon]
KNLIVAPSPIVVSKKIHKIIRKKNPKLHYTAGCFSQRLFIFLIRRLLPDDLSYTLIPKYYGL